MCLTQHKIIYHLDHSICIDPESLICDGGMPIEPLGQGGALLGWHLKCAIKLVHGNHGKSAPDRRQDRSILKVKAGAQFRSVRTELYR